MKITHQDVAHMAGLARLRFTPQERAVPAAELRRVFQYFQSLHDVDTAGVEPPEPDTPADAALCCDEELPCLPLEEVVRNAPVSEKGFFKVPNIIERQGCPPRWSI